MQPSQCKVYLHSKDNKVIILYNYYISLSLKISSHWMFGFTDEFYE